MTKIIRVTESGNRFAIDNPTPHLRFVNRDGRMILQQWWTAVCPPEGDFRAALGWMGEWVDIPVAEG